MQQTCFKWLTLSLMMFWMTFISAQSPTDYHVLIATNMGNIKVRLYNDTLFHRDHFLKLVGDKHFDGTLFYRVVKNFVIQGGSSDSRNAAPGQQIGYGTEAEIISSEFVKTCYHKKGALCAPRQPEAINHFKMSDVSQFYIVKGRKYTNAELDLMEKARNNPIMIELKRKYYLPYKDELQQLKETNPEEFNKRLRAIKEQIDFDYSVSRKMEFTDEQRQAYTTIGGCPDLDGDYTVFGEVVEGLDVVDKISALQTDKNDRPLKDVKITMSVVAK